MSRDGNATRRNRDAGLGGVISQHRRARPWSTVDVWPQRFPRDARELFDGNDMLDWNPIPLRDRSA